MSETWLKAGDTVEGRYRIISTLGEGGMGTVFLAEHVLIQRRLALKVLHARLANDVGVVERFMNEARAAGTLGHPNIVESTDMGFTRDGIPYIVFEYLEGSSLTDEIYRVGGLPVRRALRIASQIASALDAAHNAGIIHRDLKSDNVFLTDRDDVSDHTKVLDFGISRFTELEGSDDSGKHLVMGTPEYMAPEQVTDPAKVDARTDIYALGIILYEMLTARCPFRADHDPHAVLHQVIHDPPPPLEVDNLPPGLQEMILSKLIAKEPDQRYASMKDVAGAIDAFRQIVRPSGLITPLSIPIPTMPGDEVARPESVVTLPPAPPSRARGLGWLLAAVLAAGAGTVLMYLGDQPPPDAVSPRPLLEAEALKLATTLHAAAHSARLRAEGIATTPMLRAAIETDAATLKDMAGADFLFTPEPGEMLEVFQLREPAPISLLRIPESAPPIKPLLGTKTRFETDGTKLVVVVSSPIMKQGAGVGGSLAVAMPIDLAPIAASVAGIVPSATLLGLAHPIPLSVGDPAAIGDPVTTPIALKPELEAGPLSLVATVPRPKHQPRFALARFGGWGLGAALLVMYLVRLFRRRS